MIGNFSASRFAAPLAALCLLAVLAFLFRDSFRANQVVFNNDAPLGRFQAHAFDEGANFHFWEDLNWLGGEAPAAAPNITAGLFHLFNGIFGDKGPVMLAKFYPLLALWLLGIAAWLFFRALRFQPAVCLLGALAAVLNGDFFWYACWGLSSAVLAAACMFLALAAITAAQQKWSRPLTVLAGLAVGLGVTEGYDVGALFSLCLAGYVMVLSLNTPGLSMASRAGWGVARVVVVAGCAAVMAASTLSSLQRTQLKDMSGEANRPKFDPLVENFFQQLDRDQDGQINALELPPQALPNSLAHYDGNGNDALDRRELVGGLERDWDERARQQKWDFATQWSLPKAEMLRMAIPGFFGYNNARHGWLHLPVNDGSDYWGAVGQQPALTRALDKQDGDWDKAYASLGFNIGLLRWDGHGGFYMGVLVLVLAVLALAQSLRPVANGPWSPGERRMIWCWAALAFVALLFAFGRFAPFYNVIYPLPFFSSMRNPYKFMHLVSLALVVLAAYGMESLARTSLRAAADTVADFPARLREWWAEAAGFQRRWLMGSLALMCLILLGWIVLVVAKSDLTKHLDKITLAEMSRDRGFQPLNEHDQVAARRRAADMAAHTVAETGWFVLTLAAALVVVALAQSGAWTGANARWVWVVLGVFLAVDLGRGNAPYVIHYDWKHKYASNPIFDQHLRRDPHLQRVAMLPYQPGGLTLGQIQRLRQAFGSDQQKWGPAVANMRHTFSMVYGYEWMQHLFQYYRVQTLGIVQEPRAKLRKQVYQQAFGIRHSHNPNSLALTRRYWELTNTRYLIGARGRFDGELSDGNGTQLFKPIISFIMLPKEGRRPETQADWTVQPDALGLFALYEFQRALPRARLFTHWRSGVSDDLALQTLSNTNWSPHTEVLLAERVPEHTATTEPGTVEFVSYDPKRIELKTQAGVPSVLLLNDLHHPDWKVTVDGKPAQLLRANYLMRAVQVPAGQHTVEFRYAPSSKGVLVSFGGLGLALMMGGWMIWPRWRRRVIAPSGDPQIPMAPETSGTSGPPEPSRRKSRSRSGRRKGR